MTIDEEVALAKLIDAARQWRSMLIPKTSTATWSATRHLLTVIAAFDRQPCTHPRSWRIYRPYRDDVLSPPAEGCGYCGAEMPVSRVEDTKPL